MQQKVVQAQMIMTSLNGEIDPKVEWPSLQPILKNKTE